VSDATGVVEAADPGGAAANSLAAIAIGLLNRRGLTVGTAESLTGGLIAATLTTVPGASAVFRGGIVAYAADVKATLLGVPSALLSRVGTVHPDVAVAMAVGATERLDVGVAIAVTGVAGPDPADGLPVGTVHVALVSPDGVRHRPLRLTGDRGRVRQATVTSALSLLVSVLSEDNS
jgi:nicotinamide-nucleotide amidase